MLTHGTKNASTVLKVKDRMENCGKVFAGAPLYLVAIDILSGLPVTQDGLKYVLVVTDYFSKWTDKPMLYQMLKHLHARRFFTTNCLLVSDCADNYTATKAKTSSQNSLQSCAS